MRSGIKKCGLWECFRPGHSSQWPPERTVCDMWATIVPFKLPITRLIIIIGSRTSYQANYMSGPTRWHRCLGPEHGRGPLRLWSLVFSHSEATSQSEAGSGRAGSETLTLRLRVLRLASFGTAAAAAAAGHRRWLPQRSSVVLKLSEFCACVPCLPDALLPFVPRQCRLRIISHGHDPGSQRLSDTPLCNALANNPPASKPTFPIEKNAT